MSNELTLYDFSRKISDVMDYRLFMEKSLIQESTNAINDTICEKAEQIMKSNAIIGAAQINSINNQTSIINLGFARIEYKLGELGASFRAGAMAIIDATFKMSEKICDRLDVIADIANNPRRTEAREYYRDGARNFFKGFYEEARDFLKQALEKDKTDYRSWYLLGIIYLRGKAEYSDVINLDDAIMALNNAMKYFSPEISEYKKALAEYESNSNVIKNRKIIIISFDFAKKVDLIKQVREITGLGLLEAKNLVETMQSGINQLKPDGKLLMETNVSLDKYNEMCQQLIYCGASLEPYIDIPDLPNPMPLAAEIIFFLGQARRFKSNELQADNKPDNARTVLLEAKIDYEKSFNYSDKMFEAQYNIARCKALLGDLDGALADLNALIIKDNAYIIKLELESDFDVIRETYYKRKAEEE